MVLAFVLSIVVFGAIDALIGLSTILEWIIILIGSLFPGLLFSIYRLPKYRAAFESLHRPNVLSLLLLPLVGLAIGIAFKLDLITIGPPVVMFLLAMLSAHALLARIIAIDSAVLYSRSGGHLVSAVGMLLGCFGIFPAVIVLSPDDDIQRFWDLTAAIGIPTRWWTFVIYPLVIAILYGIRQFMTMRYARGGSSVWTTLINYLAAPFSSSGSAGSSQARSRRHRAYTRLCSLVPSGLPMIRSSNSSGSKNSGGSKSGSSGSGSSKSSGRPSTVRQLNSPADGSGTEVFTPQSDASSDTQSHDDTRVYTPGSDTTEVDSGGETATSPNSDSNGTQACDVCGDTNSPDDTYCSTCGTKVQ